MSKEIKIGILAIVGIGLLIWGYNFLNGQNIFKSQAAYYVKFENIHKLEVSSPVYINGYQVGNVNDIQIDQENMQNIIVSLEVLPEIKLPPNTIAQLYSDGVMGEMAIKLVYSGLCDSDCIENGSFIQGETLSFLGSFLPPDEINGYLDQLKVGVAGLVDTLSGIMADPEFESSEMGKMVKSIQSTVHNLESGTDQFNHIMSVNSKALNRMILHLEQITGGIAANQENLNNTIQSIADMTTSLADGGLDKTLNNTNAALENLSKAGDQTTETLKSLDITSTKLNSLLEGMNSGQGTLGKLMKNDDVYTELNSTLQNLDLLLQDFRLNPKRYVNVSVFGKKQKDYTVPENDPAMERMDRDTTN